MDLHVSEKRGMSRRHGSKAAAAGTRRGDLFSLTQGTDGRCVVTYGYRSVPYSIRAKIGEDNGRTWGLEIIL